MRCEESQLLLEDFADGEAGGARDLTAHLAACEGCASVLARLRREKKLYAWYEEDIWAAGDLAVAPTFWAGVSARIAAEKAARAGRPFARLRGWLAAPAHFKPAYAVAALLLVALASAWAIWVSPRRPHEGGAAVAANSRPEIERGGALVPPQGGEGAQATNERAGDSPGAADDARAEVGRRAPSVTTANPPPAVGRAAAKRDGRAPSGRGETSAALVPGLEASREDVSGMGLSEIEVSRVGVSEIDVHDSETIAHFGQAQNLLRTLRHADAASAAEFAYEKRLSRRLLDRNVLLRLGAAAEGDLPVEETLSNIEPVLLDIAHLPDRPSPAELRPIRERIERGALIAALQVYQPPTR